LQYNKQPEKHNHMTISYEGAKQTTNADAKDTNGCTSW